VARKYGQIGLTLVTLAEKGEFNLYLYDRDRGLVNQGHGKRKGPHLTKGMEEPKGRKVTNCLSVLKRGKGREGIYGLLTGRESRRTTSGVKRLPRTR